jgi:hypothetical protein
VATPTFNKIAIEWTACLDKAEASIIPNSTGPVPPIADEIMRSCADFETKAVDALVADGFDPIAATTRMRSLLATARRISTEDLAKQKPVTR